MDWKTLYFEPKGRIGQKDFWVGLAIVFAIAVVFGLIFSFVFAAVPAISTVFALALLFPYYCLATKRLHDFGKPDTFAMIVVGANAIVQILSLILTPNIAGMSTGNPEAMMADPAFGSAIGIGALSLLVTLATLGFVLWIGLTKGDEGPNVYGPPREPSLIKI